MKFIIALTWIFFCSPALADNVWVSDFPNIDKETKAVTQPSDTLAAAIAKCFETNLVISQQTPPEVSLRVRIEADGSIKERPDLIRPERAEVAERRQFRLAMQAIKGCQPYILDGSVVVRDITFSGRAISTSEAVVEPKAKQADTLSGSSAQPRAFPDGSAPFVGVGSSDIAEKSLQLSTEARREIQGRLSVLGHGTRGIDGVFGPGTRGAIKAWQTSRGFEANGYLDAAQISALREETATVYKARRSKLGAGRTSRTESSSPVGRYIDGRGCMREGDGRVVPGYKARCK